jgi:hypothetical protein
MTFYAFRLLSPVVQLYWVLRHGTFLAQRWKATGVQVLKVNVSRTHLKGSVAHLFYFFPK